MSRYDDLKKKHGEIKQARQTAYARMITDIITAIIYQGYDEGVRVARKLASENVGDVLDKKKNEYVPDRAMIEHKANEYLSAAREEITNFMGKTPMYSSRVFMSIVEDLKLIGAAQRAVAEGNAQKIIDYINKEPKLSERLCLKLIGIIDGDGQETYKALSPVDDGGIYGD